MGLFSSLSAQVACSLRQHQWLPLAIAYGKAMGKSVKGYRLGEGMCYPGSSCPQRLSDLFSLGAWLLPSTPGRAPCRVGRPFSVKCVGVKAIELVLVLTR